MTDGSPLISIIVPSYNQGSFIRETLDSILSQDYRPLEVLVLDGASKDDTVAVLQSYGDVPELKWWSEPDRGVVDAVNKGLARASGAILGIQSSDDVYLPGALTSAAAAFAADPELALVYGDVEYIDAQSRTTGGTNLPPFHLHEYVGKLTYIPQAAAFFTASAARTAGGWRDDVSYAADAEFYLRIVAAGKALKIDRRLARYRYHEAQRDKAGNPVIRDWTKSIDPYLTSPDRALRRYARGGIHLVQHHYTPEEAWLRRTIALYRAVLANPALLRRKDIRAQREFLPGRYPIWRMLSRIKQFLGVKRR